MKLSICTLALLSSALARPAPNFTKRTPNSSIKLDVAKQSYDGTDATAFNGGYWFANITAGNEVLEVVIDTGSSVTWAFSPESPYDQMGDQNVYDPTISETAGQYENENFTIAYGDGRNVVHGPVYQDTLCIGETCVAAAIGVAQDIRGFAQGQFRSGMLGLGFSANTFYQPVPLPTFMESLMPSLPEPIFTCDFRPDDTGSIEFGAVDPESYTGDLQVVNIDNSTNHWTSPNVRFVSNGQDLGGSMAMTFDTGGAPMLLPNETLANYFAQLGEEVWFVDRQWIYRQSAVLPDLQLVFETGAIATIPGELTTRKCAEDLCASWMVSSDGSDAPGNIGHPLFIANIVVFDQATPEIRFAPRS